MRAIWSKWLKPRREMCYIEGEDCYDKFLKKILFEGNQIDRTQLQGYDK